jgi:hypothetical protein
MPAFSSKALLLPVAFVSVLSALAGCEDEDFKAPPRDASTGPDGTTKPMSDGSILEKDAGATVPDAIAPVLDATVPQDAASGG